jgi:ABC-type Fe3+-citrate transport system substrate-binding protein
MKTEGEEEEEEEKEEEEEEEEERCVRLEKRLEPNVDFDDALLVLDSTRISNLEQPWMGAILYEVGANTHKEFDSEVIMTLAPVINEGVSCLSFRLEYEEQLVPCGYITELLGYKKEARSKLMSKKKMLEGFLGNDFERRLQGTQNFSLLGFLWDQVHEARKVEMRGEGTSWRKLIFLLPMKG